MSTCSESLGTTSSPCRPSPGSPRAPASVSELSFAAKGGRASAGRAVAGRQYGGCHCIGYRIQCKSGYWGQIIDSIRIAPISPERPEIDDLTVFPNDGVELQ